MVYNPNNKKIVNSGQSHPQGYDGVAKRVQGGGAGQNAAANNRPDTENSYLQYPIIPKSDYIIEDYYEFLERKYNEQNEYSNQKTGMSPRRRFLLDELYVNNQK